MTQSRFPNSVTEGDPISSWCPNSVIGEMAGDAIPSVRNIEENEHI